MKRQNRTSIRCDLLRCARIVSVINKTTSNPYNNKNKQFSFNNIQQTTRPHFMVRKPAPHMNHATFFWFFFLTQLVSLQLVPSIFHFSLYLSFFTFCCAHTHFMPVACCARKSVWHQFVYASPEPAKNPFLFTWLWRNLRSKRNDTQPHSVEIYTRYEMKSTRTPSEKEIVQTTDEEQIPHELKSKDKKTIKKNFKPQTHKAYGYVWN